MLKYNLSDYDYRIINEIIETYDKLYPTGVDSIGATIVTAKREQEELVRDGKVSSRTGAKKANEAGMRLSVTMPPGLYILIKKKYPTLFSQNLNWFRRKFPQFVIAK